MGTTDTVKGRISRINYKNSENGYTVLTVSADAHDVTVVGTFPFLAVGETVEFTGEFVVHRMYGEQLKAVTYKRFAPTNKSGILQYLSSGAIKGIGPATAARIIDKFGDRALEVIKDSPFELATVRGISKSRAEEISATYNEQFGLQEVMMFLSKWRISLESAASVYRVLGSNAVDLIKNNPYILYRDDLGFSFERVDEIAEMLGVENNNRNRIFAGVEYVLKHNLLNGHTCLPREKIVSVSAESFQVSVQEIDYAVDQMILNSILVSRVIDNRDFIFLREYYEAEEYIASKLKIMQNTGKSLFIDELEIDYAENKQKIKYDEMQRTVIKSAFQNSVMVLTGGPGTGKTTVLNGLITLFEQKKQRVVLAAPTGRAAQRMTELCGREAKTIHRLLEVQWGEGDLPYFSKNERNPIECDVIIIDEMSMVDSLLFCSLLKALLLGTRIILVGDSNQLPSVSAGNVLHDIIDSNVIPSVCLTKIFRQAGQSLIVKNAHAIIGGLNPELDCRDGDFFMLDCATNEKTAQTVVDLCSERLPAAYGLSPFNDIQVLCPSKKLMCGTISLNVMLQERLNFENTNEIKSNGFSYREKDKVMHNKNNYDIIWKRDNGEEGIGVYNGDIGFIERIDVQTGTVAVRYDDRVALYYQSDLSELEPAYAVTVHKSQGSEFDCVIIPVFDIPGQLVYRNLLYTAVTRAKRILILVGNRKIIEKMVANDRKMLRYTGLKSLLGEE